MKVSEQDNERDEKSKLRAASEMRASLDAESILRLGELDVVWIWSTDRDGRFVYSSPKVRTILGYPPDELIGTSVFDLIDESVRSEAESTLREASSKGRSFRSLIVEFKTAGGDKVLIDTYGNSVNHLDRGGLIAVSRDVTEQTRAARESRLKEFYLNRIPAYVVVSELDGTVSFCNDAPLAAFGVDKPTVIGRKFYDQECWAYSPALRETLIGYLAKTVNGSEIVAELEAIVGDRAIPLKYTCSPLRDEKGAIFAILHTGTPIIEQRQAMDRLEQALKTVEKQAEAIRQLSAPILQIWDGILALPIIGEIDSVRSATLMEKLLAEVVRQHARFVILDVTGVASIDTQTTSCFIKMVQATQLIGAKCILTGISPAVAQSLTQLGVSLEGIITLPNLKAGLSACLKKLQ